MLIAKSKELLPPIHPGEILRDDFMAPLGLSMNKLALELHVSVTRIAEIAHERRGVTPPTALRLGRYFKDERTQLERRRADKKAPKGKMIPQKQLVRIWSGLL